MVGPYPRPMTAQLSRVEIVTDAATPQEDRSETYDRLRDDLVGEQVQLVEQLTDLAGSSAGLDEGFADSGQVAAEQGESRALAARLREQLDDVEGAIARLADGTYGRCEICGNEIAEDRLEAMPATRFCIEHANG
jgi:DnaK suppressor protein